MFTSENSASGRENVETLVAVVKQSGKTYFDTETLVQLVKSKNERGFNIIYDNYCGSIYSILMKFVQRKDVADELLHEVFTKIWTGIDAYDPEKGTLFRWILHIARNYAIDYLRSSSSCHHLLHLPKDLIELQNDDSTSKNPTDSLLESKDIKNKVLQLDTKYADVIDLLFFYGCSYEQTARIMKLTIGTVKSRARKGLLILKNLSQH